MEPHTAPPSICSDTLGFFSNAILCMILSLPLFDARAEPPFSGTIFPFPDVITDSVPSRFEELTYKGQDNRLMFDRRINAFAVYFAHLFKVTYSDEITIEFQVNPEFNANEAEQIVEFYATVIGRIPRALRDHVATSWIHKGDELFGGGNNNLLIHTGSIAQTYIQLGILEEVFVHEAVHTSLDSTHAKSPGWLVAQQADPDFISDYARSFPEREDLAESFVPWLAVRCAADQIDPVDIATIKATIPNRLAYLDSLGLDLQPLDCGDSRIFRDRFETSTFKDCAECPAMVMIPSESFIQRAPESEPQSSNSERPQRTVDIPAFAISQTAVTFDE